PLPFTAMTRTFSPVSGSRASNFALVLPPPKFVIRRSAPSRFDRYFSRTSGSTPSRAASLSSHRLGRSFVSGANASGTSELQVIEEPPVLRVPAVGRRRLEALDRERSIDHRARLVQRPHGAG